MIIIKNRELLIPKNEQFIGTVYDNNADTRYFKIDRMLNGQIDLSGFTFVADVKYSNAATDSLSLTKDEINEDYIVLKMTLPASVLSNHVGNMAIQVRCSDLSGRTWSSAPSNMYIMDQLSNPGAVVASTTLTELQQTETSIETSETLRIAAESARATAETGRVSAETSRVSAELSRVSAESARVSAESARVSAESGRTSAESLRVSAESGRASAESLRVSAESARVSAENSRVSAEASRVSAEAARAAEFDEKSLESEGWAKGTQNDVPVTSESPYYHDNSKYYSQQADAESLEAEGWAKGTQNGVEVTSESPYYHDNSKYYKEQAGQATVGFVSYATEQDLNATAKARARGNIDAYTKPASGIPSTDLTSAVQTSLGKANTALQEHQSLAAYRTSEAQDVIDAGKAAAVHNHDDRYYTESETDTLFEDKADKTALNKVIQRGWNQLVAIGTFPTTTINGVTFKNNGDGSITINGTASGNAYITANNVIANGHNVAFLGINNLPSGCLFYDGYDTGSGGEYIRTVIGNTLYLLVLNGTTVSNVTIKPQVVDLTALGLDSITTVAQFRSLYSADYYPFSLPFINNTDNEYQIAMDGFISPTINGIKNYWDGSLYHRRIARVDLGSLEWGDWGSGMYRAVLSHDRTNRNAYCLSLTYTNDYPSWVETDNCLWLHDDYDYVLLHYTTASSISDLKSRLSGKFLYYTITEQTCNIDANGLRFELLWENASPFVSFPPHAISLDLSKYSYLLIKCNYNSNDINNSQNNICRVGEQTTMTSFSADMYLCGRKCDLSNNRVDFLDAYFADHAVNNNNCIPYRIYGLR